MNCPKCHSPRMIPVDHNMPSSLAMGYSGVSINGLSCQICGYYVDVVPEPVIRKALHVPKHYYPKRVNLTDLILLHLDTIKEMRKAKMSWQKIRDELDLPCTYKHLGSVAGKEIVKQYSRKNAEK